MEVLALALRNGTQFSMLRQVKERSAVHGITSARESGAGVGVRQGGMALVRSVRSAEHGNPQSDGHGQVMAQAVVQCPANEPSFVLRPVAWLFPDAEPGCEAGRLEDEASGAHIELRSDPGMHGEGGITPAEGVARIDLPAAFADRARERPCPCPRGRSRSAV